MDPELHLTTIATEGAEVAGLPADGLGKPVRACPGWDVERLVGHLGRTHVWATNYLASDPGSEEEVSAGPRPPQGHEILSWYRECLDELLEELERHDPASRARNFTGRGDAAFWYRRQAHEITMHRWDAEDAITPGGAMRSPSLTAADGIDEWLEVFVPRFLEAGGGPPADLVGGSLHIHCTDDDLEPGTGEWLLRLTSSGCEVERAHAKGDAALRGPAFDVLLTAWHRIDLSNIDVVGDVDREERSSISSTSRNGGGTVAVVKLPVMPPITPMLAKASEGLPAGDEGAWWFEPKWDGFRVVVFRDGDEVSLESRGNKSLTRYFPDVLDPLREALPDKAVVDGEIVVPTEHGLDFDLLGQRIHPAASRVERLAEETPAEVVAFDVLAVGKDDLIAAPMTERRAAVEEAIDPGDRVHLNRGTLDREQAHDWFVRFEGAGLDGVIGKPVESSYRPGERGWVKIKHSRTADVVVAGYRTHKDGEGVGSLLLGLHDEEGRLHSVGVASSFKAAQRRELRDELAPLVLSLDDMGDHPWGEWMDPEAHADGRMPGSPSRWNGKKDLSFTPLRPTRVAEVGYERVDHGRFRHTSRFLRWRPDREPASCRYDQLEVVPPVELAEVLGKT